MARAITSLPEPLSPSISTEASLFATVFTVRTTSCITRERPTTVPNPSRSIFSRSRSLSSASALISPIRFTCATMSSFRNGLTT
jgi:hypothetical protein